TMPSAPAFLQRQTSNNVPIAGESWQAVQPKQDDPCNLVTFVAPGTPVGSPPASLLLPGSPPPATIISLVSGSNSSSGGLPTADVGLMSPELTELLPNPASPQSDSEDEFTEIYNPNSVTFDLSGFKLQTGTTTKHTYTFPAGTTIAAKTFAAYPSANISISLTNSSGQVWLLDPNDNIISQTDAYTNAQDGQAWALANGKWYWTTTPTPGSANIITGNSSGSSKSGSGVGTVLGTTTTASPTSSSFNDNPNQPTPIHSSVLVGVGVLALLYGVYEYRQDIANYIYRFKRYRTARRENRAKA
ncbi:MAG: lamin tail domain-containing protein, partial [Minisyncoccia bacterium]